MNIVYTAVSGDFDPPKKAPVADMALALVPPDCFGAWESKGWETQELPSFSSLDHPERRNAKLPKVLPDLFFGYDYSLWLDGSLTMKVSMEEVVAYIKEDPYDIAIFAHPDRDSPSTEAAAIKEQEKDSVENMEAQKEFLLREKAYAEGPLLHGGFLLRKNTEAVRWMNLIWWEQICRFSSRDQMNLPYAIKKSGVKTYVIPGGIERQKLFTMDKHKC